MHNKPKFRNVLRKTASASSNSPAAMEARRLMPPPPPRPKLLRVSSTPSVWEARHVIPPLPPKTREAKELHKDGYYWVQSKDIEESKNGLILYFACQYPDCPVNKVITTCHDNEDSTELDGDHNHARPGNPENGDHWWDNDEDEDEPMEKDESDEPGSSAAGSSRPARSRDGTDAMEVLRGDDTLDDGNEWKLVKYTKFFECATEGCSASRVLERDRTRPGVLIARLTGRHTHLPVDIEGSSSQKPKSHAETDSLPADFCSFEASIDGDDVADGYDWIKYGVVKHTPYPRYYYKCAVPGCKARKHKQRNKHEPEAVRVKYKGLHGHAKSGNADVKTPSTDAGQGSSDQPK